MVNRGDILEEIGIQNKHALELSSQNCARNSKMPCLFQRCCILQSWHREFNKIKYKIKIDNVEMHDCDA